MSQWRPSAADIQRSMEFKANAPQRHTGKRLTLPNRNARHARLPALGVNPAAPREGPPQRIFDVLNQAISDMKAAVLQNQQRWDDVVTEIKLDAHDEVQRLWKALGRGDEDPELVSIEGAIDSRGREAADLRRRLRELGEDPGALLRGGSTATAAAINVQHPLARSNQEPGYTRTTGGPNASVPAERLDRALAAREAALEREASALSPAASLLPRRGESLSLDWLPKVEEGSSSSPEVREAMQNMASGLQALLGDEDGEEHSGDTAAARSAFDRFDADGSGTIDLSELTALLEDALSLSPSQCREYARAIFTKLDKEDGEADGRIGWLAFRRFYAKALSTEAARKDLAAKALEKVAESEIAKQRAWEAFSKFDCDGSGTISHSELNALLRAALGDLAMSLTGDAWDALVSDAMRRGDKDKNGTWDAAEFETFFRQCLGSDKLRAAYERKLVLRFSEHEGKLMAMSFR